MGHEVVIATPSRQQLERACQPVSVNVIRARLPVHTGSDMGQYQISMWGTYGPRFVTSGQGWETVP